MSTTYVLWELRGGNAIWEYPTRAAALAEVRAMIARDGKHVCRDLLLEQVDAHGDTSWVADGAYLREVAEEALSGARVRVKAGPPALTLSSDTGTVVRPDPRWDGYYLVRLDTPATYDNAVAPAEHVSDIRVALDNLEVLELAG